MPWEMATRTMAHREKYDRGLTNREVEDEDLVLIVCPYIGVGACLQVSLGIVRIE